MMASLHIAECTENKSMLAKLYQPRLPQNSMTYDEYAVKLILSVSERDHIQGPNTAPVTLVEYGDYECPYCAQAYLIIKEVQERLGTNLRLVFRNFPVTSARPRAYRVALASRGCSRPGQVLGYVRLFI